MGLFLAKLNGKKSKVKQLEKLEKEIKDIEDFRKNAEVAQEVAVNRLVMTSVGVYAAAILFLTYFWKPATVQEMTKCLLPLLIGPFFIMSLKKGISWNFERKLSRDQERYKLLRERKLKIINEVMETETYKTAKEILDVYAPDIIRRSIYSKSLTTDFASNYLAERLINNSSPISRSYVSNSETAPLLKTMPPQSSASAYNPPKVSALHVPPLIKPPIKPTTVLKKWIKYLFSEGDGNYFALICKKCGGHNGMALKDDFEATSFMCCYCFYMNMSKKCEEQLKQEKSTDKSSSETSVSEKMSAADSETDVVNKKDESIGYDILNDIKKIKKMTTIYSSGDYSTEEDEDEETSETNIFSDKSINEIPTKRKHVDVSL